MHRCDGVDRAVRVCTGFSNFNSTPARKLIPAGLSDQAQIDIAAAGFRWTCAPLQLFLTVISFSIGYSLLSFACGDRMAGAITPSRPVYVFDAATNPFSGPASNCDHSCKLIGTDILIT